MSNSIFFFRSEKEVEIFELRQEGEKLSKQQLQQSNVIKRLRSKDRENQQSLSSYKFVCSTCIPQHHTSESSRVPPLVYYFRKKLEEADSAISKQKEELFRKNEQLKKTSGTYVC